MTIRADFALQGPQISVWQGYFFGSWKVNIVSLSHRKSMGFELHPNKPGKQLFEALPTNPEVNTKAGDTKVYATVAEIVER